MPASATFLNHETKNATCLRPWKNLGSADNSVMTVSVEGQRQVNLCRGIVPASHQLVLSRAYCGTTHGARSQFVTWFCSREFNCQIKNRPLMLCITCSCLDGLRSWSYDQCDVTHLSPVPSSRVLTQSQSIVDRVLRMMTTMVDSVFDCSISALVC